ncbi:MAG: branched-chain amino acid transporter permease, partial [Frankiales bacterium]|nr:branched-chain amino acid transporter permease [Frankiales bacterium]
MTRDRSVGTFAGLLGALTLVVACFLSWSQSAGFPGQMLNSGYPGGARTYALLLGVAAFVVLALDTPGRAKAVRAAAVWSLVITASTAVFIGYAFGGLVNVATGAWVAVVGSVLMVLGAYLLPESKDRARTVFSLPDARWRGPVEIVITLAAAGLALYVFVVGLGIPDSTVASSRVDHVFRGAISMNDMTNGSEFMSFVFALVGLFLVAARTG